MRARGRKREREGKGEEGEGEREREGEGESVCVKRVPPKSSFIKSFYTGALGSLHSFKM